MRAFNVPVFSECIHGELYVVFTGTANAKCMEMLQFKLFSLLDFLLSFVRFSIQHFSMRTKILLSKMFYVIKRSLVCNRYIFSAIYCWGNQLQKHWKMSTVTELSIEVTIILKENI